MSRNYLGFTLSILFIISAFVIGIQATHADPSCAQGGNCSWFATSTPVCTTLTSNLRTGDTDQRTNGQVSLLQHFLVSGGYLTMPGNAPFGYFGGITRHAVIAFQHANQIPETGYVGPLTRAKIAAISCGNGGTGTTSTSTPSVSGIYPNSGVVGSLAYLFGSNFSATNNTVQFGTVTLSNISANNSSYCIENGGCNSWSSLTFTIPNVATGTYPVSLITPNGTSSSVNFTVSATSSRTTGTTTAPIITSINPNSGYIDTHVIVTGSGFAPTNTVNFGGGAIPGVNSSDGTSLSFAVPGAITPACHYDPHPCEIVTRQLTPGTYSVSVSNVNGTSNSVNFTVVSSSTNPSGGNASTSPSLTSLNPNSGAPGTQITITGTGFATGTISVRGVAIPTNAVLFGINFLGPFTSNGTSITFTVPNVANGVYNVAVMNPNGTSNILPFTVTGSSFTGGNGSTTCPEGKTCCPNYASCGAYLQGANILDALNLLVNQGVVNQTAAINNAIDSLINILRYVW